MKKTILMASKILEIIFIFILIVVYYLCLPVSVNSVIYIPQGSNAKIITELNQMKNQFSSFDKYLLLLFGRPQNGWIAMSEPKMSKAQMFHEISTNKAALRQITLIPGETSEWFMRKIAAPQLGLDPAKLMRELALQTGGKEGLLAPQTYSMPLGISERLFVRYLLDYSRENFSKISKKAFGDYDAKSFYKYIIVASIIQKEAADESEMPLVASVIYNRLQKNMPLQMDGMLNYGMFSHTKITPERIRTDASEFNSYKHAGLPSIAVCNVSSAAIKAAIFPAKSQFLYFVRDKKSKKHRFNKDLASHIDEINRQKKY